MRLIKNIHKLSSVATTDQIIELETSALAVKDKFNVSFKIIEVDTDNYPTDIQKIKIGAKQLKNHSNQYLSYEMLLQLSKDTFKKTLLGKSLIDIEVITYLPSIVDVVSPEWLNERMLETGTKLRDIEIDTGIDKTNLSAWVNGARPMSQPVKGMFYFYLMNRPKEKNKFYLGNIVKGIAMPYVFIDFISSQRITGILHHSGGTYSSGWNGPNNIIGVPINENWLTMLGFTKKIISIGKDNLKVSEFDRDGYLCRLITDEVLVSSEDKTIYSVHELQNDFKRQTGKDLTINN